MIETTTTAAAILEAADRMFIRHGYQRTTIEDIAKEAGIGKGSVYLHFASKEDLARAWICAWHDRVFAEMAGALEGRSCSDQVGHILKTRVVARHEKLRQWNTCVNDILASLKPLVSQQKEQFRLREKLLLADVIQEGIQAGNFRPVDPNSTAETLLLATSGLLPYTLSPDQILDQESLQQSLNDLILLLLAGIQK